MEIITYIPPPHITTLYKQHQQPPPPQPQLLPLAVQPQTKQQQTLKKCKILGEMTFETSILNRTTKKEILIKKLKEYYTNKENVEKLYKSIMEGIALRLIYWFCVSYSKKENIEINGERVIDGYRERLREYKNEMYDPYCRGERIYIERGEGEMMETTIGQLNFFRWGIEKGIIEYCEQNERRLREEMIRDKKETKKTRKIRKPKQPPPQPQPTNNNDPYITTTNSATL